MIHNGHRCETFKTLIAFSVPFFASFFLQALYGMADLYIIGQFAGTRDITAVSIGSQFMHLLTVMLVGLSMGTTVVTARFLGQNKLKSAARSVGSSATVFLAGSMVLAMILFLARGQIPQLMMTPLEAQAGTGSYLAVCFAGLPFIMGYNLISAIYRGMGDSLTPLWFVVTACLANIGLDYFFMGSMNLGPVGAAWGTVFSQGISVVVALLWMKTHPVTVHVSACDFRPDYCLLSGILKTGLPVAVQDGLIQTAFILITMIGNARGLTDAAAVGITEKVVGFLFLVPSSMLSSISALDARYLGAGNRIQAEQTLFQAMALCTGYGLVTAGIIQFTAPAVIGWFDRSPEVIAAGAAYLRAYSFDVVFAGVQFCMSGYFCAMEKSFLSFAGNLLSIVLIRIPGSWLMSVMHPETLLYMGLASPAGSLFSAVISSVFYRKIKADSSHDPAQVTPTLPEGERHGN